MAEDTEKQVKAAIIIEIAGSPKEHVEKTMNVVIEKIEEQEDLKVNKKEIAETKEAENKMFSTYADMNITFDNIDALSKFCYDYHPSSVEIEDPEKMNFSARDLSAHFNDLLNNLHYTDSVVRTIGAQNQILNNNVLNLIRNIVLLLLRERERSAGELAGNAGVKEEELKKFLDKFVEMKMIKLENGKYSINKKG